MLAIEYIYGVKRKLLKILFVVALLSVGWVIGYLNVPFIDPSKHFWVGFIACFVLMVLGMLVSQARRSNGKIVQWFAKHDNATDQNIQSSYRAMWMILAAFVFLACAALAYVIHYQTKTLNAYSQKFDSRLIELEELSDAVNKKQQVGLMSNVLTLVDEEIKQNPGGPLSNATIARIAAFSFSLKPYRYFYHDSLGEKPLSPERGQLLMALTLMDIDSTSFNKIKSKVDFSYSDLRNSSLKHIDFSGINLESADLSNADLTGINFDNSRLRDVTMTGAILNEATLNNTDIRSASMAWIQMNKGELKFTDATGADLSYGQFQHADLSGSTFVIADLTSSKLTNTSLMQSDFAVTNLTKADLSNSNLRDGRLIKANIAETTFSSSILEGVEVSSDWFSIYKGETMNKLQEQYVIVDSTSATGSTKFYLNTKD
jgi:uncharacterized protein YjbI with pentapeptide repeats